jgi:hypothetical protein
MNSETSVGIKEDADDIALTAARLCRLDDDDDFSRPYLGFPKPWGRGYDAKEKT